MGRTTGKSVTQMCVCFAQVAIRNFIGSGCVRSLTLIILRLVKTCGLLFLSCVKLPMDGPLVRVVIMNGMRCWDRLWASISVSCGSYGAALHAFTDGSRHKPQYPDARFAAWAVIAPEAMLQMLRSLIVVTSLVSDRLQFLLKSMQCTGPFGMLPFMVVGCICGVTIRRWLFIRFAWYMKFWQEDVGQVSACGLVVLDLTWSYWTWISK